MSAVVLLDERPELEQRAAVIAWARTWLGTPWRHRAGIKGQACDCAHFLLRSFQEAGVVEPSFNPPQYSRSWFVHQDEEVFLRWVVEYFHCVERPMAEAQPADVILYRIGRCYAHCAILIEPQLVMHAFAKNGQVIYSETFDTELSSRQPRAFDPWGAR
jgi:NlpC/P60 family putative phage cell wall peptidase